MRALFLYAVYNGGGVVITAIQDYSSNAAGPPVVTIGAGPAGMRFVEELARRRPGLPQQVFGEEAWPPYDRSRIGELVAGRVRLSEMQLPRPTGAAVEYRLGTRIVRIDPEARAVIDDAGVAHRYRRLVLATGARPRLPAIPGMDLPGNYTLRSLDDAQALSARLLRSRRAVVLGGGWLGLDSARALQRHGTEVTLVEQRDRLLPTRMDARGAADLRAYLASLGVRLRLSRQAVDVIADQRGHVGGVRLDGGEVLPCDTLLAATGCVPCAELARDAGLALGQGVRVDDGMRTSEPEIYAVGECAEHAGRTNDRAGPGYEQAAVAAARIAGETARYAGRPRPVRLRNLGREVYSLGEPGAGTGHVRHLHWRDPGEGVYRRLSLSRGRIVGVLALGGWPALPRIELLMRRGARVWPWQALRFCLTGCLWPRPGPGPMTRWFLGKPPRAPAHRAGPPAARGWLDSGNPAG